MVEEQILQAIADRVADDRLHFQIIIQEQRLYVYINRDPEDYLDYAQLTSNIHAAIVDLDELDFIALELYSRVLGEVEPDWQESVELAAENSPAESLEEVVNEFDTAVDNAKSLIAQVEQELENTPPSDSDTESIANSESSNQENISEASSSDRQPIELDKPETTAAASDSESAVADFSQYCFIRNQGLLNADLVAPKADISQIITTFDKFDLSIKRSQLPLLESYFKTAQEPDLSDLEPEIGTWWRDLLAIDVNTKRKLAIWFSRYCFDPESTMTTLQGVLVLQTQVQHATEDEIREKAKEKRSARNQAYLESLKSSDIEESSPEKSQYNLSYWIASIITTLLVIATRPVVRPFINNLCCSDRYASQETVVIDSQIATQDNQSNSSQAKQLKSSGAKKYHQQDFNGALEDLTAAIELYSADPEHIAYSGLEGAYNLRGLVYQQLNDYYSAINDANQAIELSPHNSEYYANRGLAYLGARDYHAAIADQSQAIKLDPKNPYWYINRGKAYYELTDHDLALADLDLAIALNSFAIEAYEQRYYTHRALGNLAAAESDYQQAKYFGLEPQK